jgi:cell division protein ZapA
MKSVPPMADKPNLVHVEIFGQSYAVRGGDPGYVEKLAAHVDEQMREVSRGLGAVDSVRIAVLAALNLADECARLREQVDEAEKGARTRVEKLARELSAALGE